MSKYQPLSDRLRGHPADEWRASFTEIEDVLGFPLPKGARAGGAWWSNDDAKPHSKAWAGHGWQAGDVDHAQGVVTFRRGAVSPAAVEAVAGLAPVGDLSGEAPPVVETATPPSAALSAQPAGAADVAKPGNIGKVVGIAALAGAAVVVGLGAVAARGLLRSRMTSRKPLDIARVVRKGAALLQRRT